MAAAVAIPIAADLPFFLIKVIYNYIKIYITLPLAAVTVRVYRNIFSFNASINIITTFAWSNVLHSYTNFNTISFVPDFREFIKFSNSVLITLLGSIASNNLVAELTGNKFNSSSKNKQEFKVDKDNINLSLNLNKKI